MKAIWYTHQGKPSEVLQWGEQPTPQAGPGQVRVKLMASAVNPADTNRTVGRSYAMEAPLIIPNSDGSGLIDQVGDGVPPRWLGQRVWLYNGQRGGRHLGTACEYIALDVGLVAPLPDNTSYFEGACLGIPCMTAHRAVRLGGELEGKNVLVTGGAGAVGHYAIQWAKHAGARVFATVSSPSKAEHAQNAGADECVNYRQDNVLNRITQLTKGAGIDHVVDVDFGGNIAHTLALLRANGSLAYYATKGNPKPKIPAAELMRKNISLFSILLNGVVASERIRAQNEITEALEVNALQHTVSEVFSLQDTALAHEAVEFHPKRGTVVIQCAENTN